MSKEEILKELYAIGNGKRMCSQGGRLLFYELRELTREAEKIAKKEKEFKGR